LSRHSIDQFLAACGLDGPWTLEISRDDRPGKARRLLTQPFALVGREIGTDLPLDDDEIGRRHAYLQVVRGRVFCVDLASRTGVHWPDGPAAAGWLDPERPLRIGPFWLRVAGLASAPPGEEDVPTPLTTRPHGLGRLPEVSLEFQNAAAGRQRWRMRTELALMGAASGCHVRMRSGNVSRHHGALLRTPAGLWVVDLMGRKGLAVNGTTARFARLEDGDELAIGEFRIALHCDESFATPESTPPAPLRLPSTALAELMPFPAAPPAELIRPGLELRSYLDTRPPEQAELLAAVLPGLLDQMGRMQQHLAGQFQQAAVALFQMVGDQHKSEMDRLRGELDRVRELSRELEALRPQLASPAPAPAVAQPRLADDRRPAQAQPEPPAARMEPPAPVDPERAKADEDVHLLLTRRLAAIQGEQQGLWQRVVNLLTRPSRGEGSL
jgi:pSer/pThr/pTyr-binding forkhead associated (FHA) protein